MSIDFSNKSQIGAFGEFIYKKYCESLGFDIKRTNYCHTDFILITADTNQPKYVDVKATLKDKIKYQGKTYHDDIAYDLVSFSGGEVLLSPDQNSPLHTKGRHSLGTINEWLAKWDKKIEIDRKRESRLDKLALVNLKDLFSNAGYPRIRIVERGDAGKRWTGTVDNLPGSLNVVNKNDATIFIEFSCEDFIEKVSKIYLIWHHLLHNNKIKMSKPSSRQAKKGIVEVIDLKVFVSEYPELVFDSLADLRSYVTNSMSQ
jgi:hypothetical protein